MKMKLKLKLKPQQFVSPSHSSGHILNHSCSTDDDEVDFYGNVHHISPLKPTNNSSIISGIDGNSDSNMINKSSSNQMMGHQNQVWNMGSLMAALPLSPSSVCSGSPTTVLQDCSQFSAEYYTPTRQDMKRLTALANTKKQHRSPRTLSISTLYESATENGFGVQGIGEGDGNTQQNYYNCSPKSLHNSTATYEHESSIIVDGDDNEVYCHVLPPVPEEMSFLQRKGIAITTNGQGFERATPVMIEEEEEEEHRMNCRPRPYQEFLEEVQNYKRKAELDAERKQKYTGLLRKLRWTEAAIDEWESKQRSKAEFQLENIERKLEKKRAKAVRKTHKKLADTKTEAQKRKAKARRLVLKEMSKLPQQIHGN